MLLRNLKSCKSNKQPPMSEQKPQQSILITGCSTGIGLHCATVLKDRGYRVFASARKSADVDKLSQAGFETVQLDLDNSESIHSAVQWVLTQTNGQLDALFNNGAYGQPGAVEDLTRDALRKQFETNLFGTSELTNLVLKTMRAQGHGRIIQNSSILGFVALPFRGAYNASKFALEGLTDTLRLELKGSNINISLIEPGPIVSAFRQNALQALHQNVDMEQSFHKQGYKNALERLSATDKQAAFTLGPESVAKRLIHALESKRPKARYYVTFPTYLMGYLKRILPTSWLDMCLLGSDDEVKTK